MSAGDARLAKPGVMPMNQPRYRAVEHALPAVADGGPGLQVYNRGDSRRIHSLTHSLTH